MHITLMPVLEDRTLSVSKQGDALTINGVVYDFSGIPNGATLPGDAIDSDAFDGRPVSRIDGTLHLFLRFPHGPGASESARFPAPIINPPDGPLELPQ